MDYGERLRLAREHKGLTQIELAELSGVNQSTISKIESGHQHSSSLDNDLAYAIDVDVFWLRTGEIEYAPYWYLAHSHAN
jgi:transcriptional regulator with XRE-family HTH domain